MITLLEASKKYIISDFQPINRNRFPILRSCNKNDGAKILRLLESQTFLPKYGYATVILTFNITRGIKSVLPICNVYRRFETISPLSLSLSYSREKSCFLATYRKKKRGTTIEAKSSESERKVGGEGNELEKREQRILYIYIYKIGASAL